MVPKRRPKSNTPAMNNIKDEIIFGAKRAGVTWLYRFESRVDFERTRAGAEKLGLSLAQWLCKFPPEKASAKGQERRFTFEDEEASTLKVQITQCDEFTRKCLKRQVAFYGYESVEHFIAKAALNILENLEDEIVLDPRTGEIIMTYSDSGDYIGCSVDDDAPNPPPYQLGRRPIPDGAIVEICP